jgi:lipase
MSRLPVESRVSVNSNELSVWEWPGKEPAIFFCHATGFHARIWDQVIGRLPERRCIAFDAREHGRSSKPAPPYNWRNFGADVAALAHLLALDRAIGVGHSTGGHAVTLGSTLRRCTWFVRVLLKILTIL